MNFTCDLTDGFLATWKGCPALADFRAQSWLEVGTLEGRSACWTMHNKMQRGGRMTVVDLFTAWGESRADEQQAVATNNIGEASRACGIEVDIVRGTLPSAMKANPLAFAGRYDGCYIDGPKEYDSCLEASRLAWSMVRPGGVLIWDDIHWDEHLRMHDLGRLGPVGWAVRDMLDEQGIHLEQVDWHATQIAVVKPGESQPTRCVVDVAFGETLCIEAHATTENHRRYAERCGADYIRIRDPQTSLPYGCSAKLAILPLLDRYDQTLYLDCDVVAVNDAPNIFDEVPLGWWGAIDEMGCVQNQPDWMQRMADTICRSESIATFRLPWCLNGGVIVCPRGGGMMLRPPAKAMPGEWTLDQMWLSIQLARYRQNLVRLDRRFNYTIWMRESESAKERAWLYHQNDAERQTRHERLRALIEERGIPCTAS